MTKPRHDRLLLLVQSYLDNHLQRTRGSSINTLRAYGHGLRLFFLFLSQHTLRPVSLLRLDDIRVEAVLAFLDHLESARKNTPATRNCRLAAVRGFVEHLLQHDIARANQYQRILAIRPKRAKTRVINYLETTQVRAILDQPDRATPMGLRDYALLLLLFNTGARIAEALAITMDDLHLDAPRHVLLHGKGKKDRVCPLWPETASALRDVVRATPRRDGLLFRSARGEVLSRDGAAYILARHVTTAAANMPELRRKRVTPHVLRHSCAVALLQAGVDITVIRDYLGHTSVATTNRYVATNVAMKRDALDAFWRRAGLVRGGSKPWRPNAKLLDLLAGL